MTLDTDDAGRLRQRAAIASLAVAGLLIVLKMATYFATESAGVLSSLMDSMLDGLSSTVTLIGVRQALRPPSRSYRFGRGKAEPLAALVQAAFILGSAVLLCVEVADRLVTTRAVRYETWGIVALIVASVIVLGLVRLQGDVVRRTGSVAIQADFRHYIGDIGINLAVIAGLVLTAVTGIMLFDTAFALVVSLFLVVNSWGRRPAGAAAADGPGNPAGRPRRHPRPRHGSSAGARHARFAHARFGHDALHRAASGAGRRADAGGGARHHRRDRGGPATGLSHD